MCRYHTGYLDLRRNTIQWINLAQDRSNCRPFAKTEVDLLLDILLSAICKYIILNGISYMDEVRR
jgi:hypothetical protein